MRESYKLIFERSVKGHKAYDLPALDVPCMDKLIPDEYQTNTELNLPELAEVDLVRHYTNLSRRNFGVDNGFYPLGSLPGSITVRIEILVNRQTSAIGFFNLCTCT